ncbi:50S ribosomal protein L25/general stress protein Ctc [Corynebacterium urealyticum]|uniref:Large ribosomal subunit protein bL25 n=2 Tax=Corynebacterium urealyticum TaxID=43771 RepID=RL25_CORU7|nr:MULTISPECIES: 50S ribosomal protein L25/general stress protein Ctc [Corynebacterium]B1VFK0.1 RecName: Full=Large ribosomal subunit protein bL25; AltName: Full=50S ribosomal protein L25; AltName: Full=General stress protein CTC [Corynebacterium urealyticum DSM 7109]AGE36151.1 50S ribosomal protein L25 [Corynebacterium urealyticum DSM 7111]MDK7134671.1 50S ribosomal protein L25/general stress protein Ctc [Corynebacterium sp. UMB4614]MDK8790575.1 50S ribosomal protein L25/general stress protein
MAELTRIEGVLRTEFGKGASRRLRRDGRIPLVVYGNELDPVHVHVDTLDLHALVRNEGVNAVFELNIDGEDNLVMVKAIDQNVLTLDIDHADLLNVKRGERVEVEVPVIHEGLPAPGAMVVQDVDVLLLEVDVLDIPEEIVLDINGLEIGEQILAKDVKMPSNAVLVSDAEELVINIVEPEEEELPEDDEAAAEGEDAAAGEEAEAPAESED